MTSFLDSIHIERFDNAEFYAAALFRECFAADFPVPRDDCGLPIPTPPASWHQYVAIYKWSPAHLEPVGFCNWIRYEDAYLQGGKCVKPNFYRRLPREHWIECRSRGGVAQLMLETAAKRLTDCAAWFGYCGDAKSWLVNARVGYERTRYRYLVVKWFRTLSAADQDTLIDKVAGIGAF
jgi:hypothetical protein